MASESVVNPNLLLARLAQKYSAQHNSGSLGNWFSVSKLNASKRSDGTDPTFPAAPSL